MRDTRKGRAGLEEGEKLIASKKGGKGVSSVDRDGDGYD